MTTPLWVSLAATRLSGAAAAIAKARIRVSHGVRRNRARTELTNEIRVLVLLRSSEVERLNLRLEATDLVVLVLNTEGRKLVGDRTGVVANRLLQIAAALLELEALIRKALSDVIVNALNGLASVAAALRKLTRHVVNSCLSLIPELAQTVGDVAELLKLGVAKLGETLVKAVKPLLSGLVVEATLDITNRSTSTVAATAAIIAEGVRYLHIEGTFYCGIGCLFLLYGLYRAVGKPGMSVVLTIVSLGTRVGLAYLLSAIPAVGVVGIWWAVPIGWFLADALGVGYYLLRPAKALSQREYRS